MYKRNSRVAYLLSCTLILYFRWFYSFNLNFCLFQSFSLSRSLSLVSSHTMTDKMKISLTIFSQPRQHTTAVWNFCMKNFCCSCTFSSSLLPSSSAIVVVVLHSFSSPPLRVYWRSFSQLHFFCTRKLEVYWLFLSLSSAK
jgi:hypothetical protein